MENQRMTRRFIKPTPRQLRGRQNQARGRRLEEYFVRKFRAAGFYCRRHDERDGFGRGVDLVFFDATTKTRRLPIVAQIKYSTRTVNASKALSQARAGDPSAVLWALCAFHHPSDPGTPHRGTYLYAYTLPGWSADYSVTVEFLGLCGRMALALNLHNL